MGKTAYSSQRDSWFLGLSLFFTLLVTPAMVFLILGVLLFLIGCISEKRKLPFEKRDILLGLFIVGSVLSGLFSAHPASSAPTALAFLIYVLVMWFGRGGNFTEKTYARAIRLTAWGVVVFSILMLGHQYLLRKPYEFHFLGMEVKLQYFKDYLVSFMPSATGGGYLMSILWLILWGYALSCFGALKWRERILVILGLLLAVLVILLTVSRAGLLMLMVGVFVTLFFYKWGRRLVIAGICVAGLGLGILFLKPGWVARTPLAVYVSPQKMHNSQDRMNQIFAGWETFRKSNPVFGIGLMNFGPLYNARTDLPPHEGINYLHNAYLALLVETGALGFLLFFSYLVIVSVRLVRRNMKRPTPASLAAISVLAGFWVTGLFEVAILYVVYTGVLLWLLIGLAENPLLNPETDGSKPL